MLITGAMGLIVLGFQESGVWGWGGVATWACIIVGGLSLIGFVAWELRIRSRCSSCRIFRDRGFSADNAVLRLMYIVFIPFFFFASVYAQVSLGKSPSNAGLYLLFFFIGFVIAAQVGGRILDRRGARPAVVLGAAIGAVGFFLLARKLTDLSLSPAMVRGAGGRRAGADARRGLNRCGQPRPRHQLQRGHRDHPDLAQLRREPRARGAGLDPVSQNKTNVTNALTKVGVPVQKAHEVASSLGQGAASASGHSQAAVHSVQLAFAQSTQTVFYIMAGVMAASFIVAVRWLPRGRVEAPDLLDTEEPESVQVA